MKRLLVLIIMLSFVTCLLNAKDNETKLGIGASFNTIEDNIITIEDGLTLKLLGTYILIPILIAERIRFEPLFGIINSNENRETSVDYPFYNRTVTVNTSLNSSSVVFGFGAFYNFISQKPIKAYTGARISYAPVNLTKNIDSTIVSRTGTSYGHSKLNIATSLTTLSLAIGGEYFLSSYFSLGVEADLIYQDISKPLFEPTGLTDITSYNKSIINHNVAFIARFYFF